MSNWELGVRVLLSFVVVAILVAVVCGVFLVWDWWQQRKMWKRAARRLQEEGGRNG